MNKRAPAGMIAVMSALVACADPVTPVRVLEPGDVSLTVTHELFAFPVPGLPANVGVGGIRLCKKVPPGDPGGTFGFTVTAAGTGILPDATPELTVPAGGEACTLAYRSQVPNVNVEQVVITEDVPPANWALTAIDTRQLLFEGIFNAGNYTTPRLDDAESVPTRTATLYINNDMAREVTFTNDFTGPGGPPPPPICDFITFGRLVTEVGGNKVVISGNAGGLNADGSIKGEFHIEANGVDNHVSDIETYGAIASGPLSGLTNSRVVTGIAKNGVLVELRLWDGGEPGKGTDRVYVKLNGVELFPNGASPFIDQGNMQYHPNCRGPGDTEETVNLTGKNK